MPLPNFTVTGNLKEILGDVLSGELIESALSQARVEFQSNIPLDAFIKWDDTMYRVLPIMARVDTDGEIVNDEGDPVLLLAQDDGLSVRGLQWHVKVVLPAQVLPPSPFGNMRTWWINAGTDGQTVDLESTLPAVSTAVSSVTVNGMTSAEVSAAIAAAVDGIAADADEIDWYANLGTFPVTGEVDKTYGARDTGDFYRWTGSAYAWVSNQTLSTGIIDSTTFGRAVLTGADVNIPVLRSSSYYRRARNIADSNGTDDTTAIQAILAEGPGEVVLRKGVNALVTAAASTFAVQSDTRWILEEGSTLQVKPSALGLYYLINLNNVHNVTIEGAGTILGDSATHTGNTGHHGHLINITNGSYDCRVLGPLHLKQAWGDGIFIGTTALCRDVLIDGTIIEDCRREGIGVFWVDGATVRNTRIFDISLTAFEPTGCPGYGIGVEPNAAQLVAAITLDNNMARDCAGMGMAVLGHFGAVTDVIVRDNKSIDCSNNSGATAGSPYGMRVKNVDNPQILNNTVIGTGWVGTTSVAGLEVDLCNRPIVRGGYYANARGPGIYMNGCPGGVVSEAYVHNNLRRGILIQASDDAIARNNDLVDNCQDDDGGTAHMHVFDSDRVGVRNNVFRGANGGAWVTVLSPSADCAVTDNTGIGTAPPTMFSDSGSNTRRSRNYRVDTGVYESWDLTGSTPMGTIELGHASDTTVARSAAGRVAIEGVEVITATAVAAVDAKAALDDDDTVVVFDDGVPKRSTWANLKSTLGVWLDTLTATWSNKTLTAPVLTGTTLIPQGGTIALHNQADQTTNYERARALWSANVFTLGTDAAGTGVVRDINVIAGVAGSLTLFASTQNATVGTVRLRANLSAANGTIAGVNGTLSATSGVQYGLSVSPTINQVTGTGGYTGLLINITQTAVGSGVKRLIDAQVGGSSLFAVDNAGVVTSRSLQMVTRSIASLATSSTLGAVSNHEYVVILETGALPTLPTAVSNTSAYRLKNNTGSPINVASTSSQTFDGVAGPYVLAPGASRDFIPHSSNWSIL